MLHHYVCVGNVRGECGHKHQTIESATACLEQDRKNCKHQGGYSDRVIEGRTVGGEPIILDEDGNEAEDESYLL